MDSKVARWRFILLAELRNCSPMRKIARWRFILLTELQSCSFDSKVAPRRFIWLAGLQSCSTDARSCSLTLYLAHRTTKLAPASHKLPHDVVPCSPDLQLATLSQK